MSTSKNSVLIVDSDKESRATLAAHFEDINWLIYTARDGVQATRIMHRDNPDIIVMDVALPVRDGIATCSLIRNDISVVRHFPIILMTALPDKKQIVRAVDAGCDGFIVKPFKFETLLDKVKELVVFYNEREKEEEIEEPVVEQEAEIVIYSRKVIEKAFANAMHGKLVDYPVIEKTVNHMVEIVHNENTLPMAFKMKSYNDYTYIHSVNVASLAMSFAHNIKWSDDDLQIVGEGSFLHDIGKTLVDLKILLKPDKLTDKEFTEIRKHPQSGKEIVCKQKVNSEIQHVILEHHEKINGSGYPKQLNGEQISKYGKLAAIIDVYDALTTDRCYHKGRDSDEAIKMMSGWSGHFNPKYFEMFANLVTDETIGK